MSDAVLDGQGGAGGQGDPGDQIGQGDPAARGRYEGGAGDAGDGFGYGPRSGPVGRLLIRLVLWYQRWLSPLKVTPSCRFEPSCSAYALEALKVHGAWRGFWLSVRRVASCGVWHPGGFDYVPPVGTKIGIFGRIYPGQN